MCLMENKKWWVNAELVRWAKIIKCFSQSDAPFSSCFLLHWQKVIWMHPGEPHNLDALCKCFCHAFEETLRTTQAETHFHAEEKSALHHAETEMCPFCYGDDKVNSYLDTTFIVETVILVYCFWILRALWLDRPQLSQGKLAQHFPMNLFSSIVA